MNSLLSKSDNRVLRSLIESADIPHSIFLASIAMHAILLRPNLDQESGIPEFQAWIKRNLKLLAAIEFDASRYLHLAFPSVPQSFIDRWLCLDTRVRTLLRYCRFASAPRHSHVSEVILGQRRLMRWILQHHPFPPELHLRGKWISQFEQDWFDALTIIPCVCNYQHAISTATKEEICSAQCKRREQLTGLILGDLHGLNAAGVAKLCKHAYKNTFPLSHRPLGPSNLS